MSKYKETKEKTKEQFQKLLHRYAITEEVKQMEQYIQHGKTTTLEHCKNVAWISFLINEKLHLKADAERLVEAGILHDFYLYDWHDGNPVRKTHGFDHPEIARRNAVKHFHISKKTQESILSHMWPLTITRVPKTREAIILCLADKYCALMETVNRK